MSGERVHVREGAAHPIDLVAPKRELGAPKPTPPPRLDYARTFRLAALPRYPHPRPVVPLLLLPPVPGQPALVHHQRRLQHGHAARELVDRQLPLLLQRRHLSPDLGLPGLPVLVLIVLCGGGGVQGVSGKVV